MVTTAVPSRSVHARAAVAVLALVASLCAATPAAANLFYSVTNTNLVFTYDTNDPSVVVQQAIPRGLQTGEQVLAIDLRPATGLIYALGSTSRLYLMSPDGIFRPVGGPFTPALSGTEFGFDFDPVTDRIRVVSNTGQNLRLNPDTGVATLDTPLAPGTPRVVGLAYGNNFAGAASTTLYGIDATTDQLVMLPSPNAGTVQVVGALGVDTTELAHLDISANDGIAYAALTIAGIGTRLYTIDLTTGAATLVRTIAGLPLRGFTVLSRGVPMLSLRNGGTELVRFHSATPGTIQSTQAITGLQAGEQLLGIDRRPSNGGIYGVSNESRLYRINPISGAATAVGSAFATSLSGFFGVDVNPLTDRLHVLTSTQENVSVNPDTGESTVEPPLSPAVHAAGAAFNNNFDGTRFATLFAINAQVDTVTSQDQLGDGTLVPIGPLGVDTTFDVGFDISPLDGVGFAALRVGGTSGLYTINLATGAARLIGPIGTGAVVNGLVALPANYQFAEGSTGAFFDTDILLANPSTLPVAVTVTYQTELAEVVTQGLTLAPQSRTTIPADANALLGETAFSTTVTSHLGLPVLAERTMRWDSTGYGMHGEKASPNLARTWYFAEGSQGFYDTYFLLTNPGPGPNAARLRFLLENGTEVIRDELLLGESRLTIYAGEIPELVNQAFGTVITFTSAGMAERAMYFGTPLFSGGHESAGATDLSTEWFLAEGATGSFFTTFVLLSNPNATPAHVTLSYFREGGGVVTRTRTVPAATRLTINVSEEDPSLVATSMATRVVSDLPIVVERAMYWPLTPASWLEASNAFGVTETALKWGFAEGRVGGPSGFQTFMLVANPGTSTANITLTILRTTGAPVVKTFSVPAGARLTITTGPGSAVPELSNESFGGTIVSDRPIFAERAMYSNASGVVFAAGSAATASQLPLP